MAMNPNYREFKISRKKPHPWSKVFRSRTSQDAIDFMAKLLQYDPKLRPNGIKACEHYYFDELRDQNTRLSSSKGLPDLFNFSKEEMDLMKGEADKEGIEVEKVREKLIPEWFKNG